MRRGGRVLPSMLCVEHCGRQKQHGKEGRCCRCWRKAKTSGVPLPPRPRPAGRRSATYGLDLFFQAQRERVERIAGEHLAHFTNERQRALTRAVKQAGGELEVIVRGRSARTRTRTPPKGNR
jgi:hypothetical protein